MIALLSTYLIVAYILVPGILFRLLASRFVRLRLFQLTRTEEAILGCSVSLVPFLLALLFVWQVPFARSHPFRLPPANLAEYRENYHRVLTLVVAEDPSRLLESVGHAETPYYLALKNIGHRQLRFLSWYYAFILLEGALFGYLTKKYGDWSHIALYQWFARRLLLQRVSEWQLLLTDFVFPKKPKRDVCVDVLCGDHLYRGRVGDYSIDKSGDLSGILLKDVDRFRRADYTRAVEQSGHDIVNRGKYWRKIPGANFYIPASEITNLNVRFPYADLADGMLDFLKELGVKAKITVESRQPGQLHGDDGDMSQSPPIPNGPEAVSEPNL